MKLLKPRYIIPNLKLKYYLNGYPLYDVPHKEIESELSEAQSKDNYNYFINNLAARINLCKYWFERSFKLDIRSENKRVNNIDEWLKVYGGLLIPNDKDALPSYMTYHPAWEGQFIGFNLIFDIATIIGEAIIAKDSSFRWGHYFVDPYSQITENRDLYQKPALFYKDRYVFDVISSSFFCCHNSYYGTILNSPMFLPQSNSIAEFVSYVLEYAKIDKAGIR